MDATVAPTGHVALWVVGLVLAAAVAARATRLPRDRGAWLVLAAAMALEPLSSLARLAAHAGSAIGPWWGLALDLLAYALVYVAMLHLLRQRLDVPVPLAVLDTCGGLAISLALGSAALLAPLDAVPGVDGAQALLLLARPCVGTLVLAFAVASVVLGGSVRERRPWMVVAAVLVVLAMDVAAVLVVLHGGPSPALSTAGSLAHLLPPLLLLLAALAADRPLPPRRDEDTHVVLTGPAAFIVAAGAVLGRAHFATLPTPAVLAALATLALVVVKVALVFRRVTALNTSRRQAVTDELTGLGNRRALAAALAPVDSGGAAALVLVDLDGFKEVNDQLGHAAGDQLLQQVAQRLRAHVGERGRVARQGGDEFALVLPGADAATAAQRAALLRGHLGEPYELDGRTVRVAASAGVCAAPEHGRSAEVLLRRADAAMYLAKTSGRGVVVHDPAVDDQRRDRLQLGRELRAAVAAHELVVHFQPQLESATGDPVGVEALVRWPHPVRGVLAPGVFLELAQELGLMDELTDRVLDLALAEAARWRAAGHPVRVAVNVSATCLLDPGLTGAVAQALVAHGVPADQLVLEVTETELMRDPGTSHRVVSSLVDLGVEVSIDDYGTGYSSLAYLRDLPVSELKLDRTFVASLTSDPRAAAIVRTTVDLAHSLGLRLVAEGVEDAETLGMLHALGADVTQGYHHSRPLAPEALRVWLTRHGAVALAEA